MNDKNHNELETNNNDNEPKEREINLDDNKDNIEEKKESSSFFSKYYSKFVSTSKNEQNTNDNPKDNDTTSNHENKENTDHTFNKDNSINNNNESNENEYISKDINLDGKNISEDKSKKKKKREVINSEELIIDSKRKKNENIIDYYKIDDKSEIDLLKSSQENNSIHEKEDDLTGSGGIHDNDSTSWSNKYSEHEISLKRKQQIDICNEILGHLQSKYYEQILNIENNFKNLENKIEDNNFFHFNCIMEKLRNKKYDNILLIFDDIHMYLNNLLYLSKPSSYIWMKLHELLNQVANTLLNIHQMKREAFNEIDYNYQDDDNKNDSIIESQTIEQSINEEEKLSFQLLLGKLHQDIHFELFRKFKSKAVWKTLEGGEIELDDKLTKADVFREMYNWCKLQLDLKDKRSEISESESDSSKDSY
ncbi:conserved Plasmodium protein, unknown function [Plasmodium vinckei petteri]|uniref:Uncharacterized protein n=1 Tax=Plasmodium vinckei petteri TaxID=138298 RepID=A0A6V7SXS2_PLAVN|nr:conserved Plasmodium protein, unknown function [Plasmodium vinckei petteri]